MWRLVAVGLLTVGIAAPAVSSDWWYVADTAEAPERSVNFIDRSSITAIPVGKQAWTRMFNESHDTFKDGKVLVQFDCKAKRYRPIQAVFLTWDGHTVSNDQPRDWQNMVPDSAFDWMLRTACGLPMKVKPTKAANNDPETVAARFFAH